MPLDSRVVKIDSEIIISLRKYESVTQHVLLPVPEEYCILTLWQLLKMRFIQIVI